MYTRPLNINPQVTVGFCLNSQVSSPLETFEDLETIAKNIMNLTKKIKTGTTKVAILGIIPRRDTFKQEAKQVNKTLKKICEEENIPFISYHDINTRFI